MASCPLPRRIIPNFWGKVGAEFGISGAEWVLRQNLGILADGPGENPRVSAIGIKSVRTLVEGWSGQDKVSVP